MTKTVKLDKRTAHRAKGLGDVGEDLTESLLTRNGFTNIKNLNRLHNNFPFADFYAEKHGIKYVISVKMRNRYEFRTDGKKRINPSYKLGRKCYDHAAAAELRFDAKAAWLTISLDRDSYSAYFGLLSSLDGRRVVRMTDKWIGSYDCLAKDVPHHYNYDELKNVYESVLH